MNAATLPRRRAPWRPTPLVAGSIGLHGLVGAGAVVAPDAWPWALGAIAANHLALIGSSLWPRADLLGPNLTRLPPAAARRGEIALTFDDGPDPEVTPRVLDMLDAHDARATFFCIARNARVQGPLCREAVRRGHRVENHSFEHRATFSLLTASALHREIAAAQATLADITGQAPRFFRAPAGLRNPFLDPVLHELDLALVSWTRRGFDTLIRDPAAVGARLVRGLAAGDILLLHDGHSARGADGQPVVLGAFEAVIDKVRERGLRSVPIAAALAA